MYQNRHPGTSHNQTKEQIPDYLDRIREEYNALRQQLQSARIESDKHAQEREGFQRQMMLYYEMICTTQIEVAKQMEIAKRLAVILQQVIQLLPAEQQPQIIQALERAKNVTPQDIMNPMQQQMPMVPPTMLPPNFNPFLAAAAAGMNIKPEDINAMAAQFTNMKGLPGMMPPMGANPMASLASVAATTSQAHPLHSNNNNNNNHHNSSSTPVGQAEGSNAISNNSRAASTSAALSRPHSGSATPVSSKRLKTEPQQQFDDHNTDGELEIDVQNDDATTAASSSARPSSNTHTNGTSHNNKHGGKSGRESAQSVGSSRDSSATPKSKQNAVNSQAAAMASMAASLGLPRGAAGADLNALFGGMGALAGGTVPFLDPSGRLVAPVTGIQSNGSAPYAYKVMDGGTPLPVQFPSDATTGANIPKDLKPIAELQHNEVVCAITIAPENSKVYTGGQGCIKVWDISRPKESTRVELSKIDCQIGENYVRSCKLLPDNNMLLVGGESNFVSIIDLTAGEVVKKLDCGAQACYALVVSRDGRQCYTCCADGNILIWDLVSHECVATLKGHEEGASCVDLSADGKLWTGGLDHTVCTWDIGEQKRINQFQLESQVFSLSCSPTEEFVAVGTESNKIEVLSTSSPEKYILHEHENCVLSLKFAHNGPWFVSTGKDSKLVVWRSPFGARLLRAPEKTSVLSCDIASNDQFIVTGSGDKRATLYEVFF